jgi:molybdopterin-guanine dinucleotide biosynthesis protein A
MTLLGAIFAGGASRRFGSDKALADIDGVAMLERVVVGREWPGLESVADLPRPGLGPLGALAGALAFGAAHGHEAVLTSGCDLPDLPLDLAERLRPGPAVVRGQPLLGLWPVELAGELVRWLEADRDRAMRSWIAHAGARIVALPFEVRNVNRPEDLEGRPPQ